MARHLAWHETLELHELIALQSNCLIHFHFTEKTFMIFRSQPRMKMGSLSHNVDTTNSEYMT
jgi:hypothetical protein